MSIEDILKKVAGIKLTPLIPTVVVTILLLIALPSAFTQYIKFNRPGYYFDNDTHQLFYHYYSDWFMFVNADWQESEDPELKDFEHTYSYNSIKWSDAFDFKDSEIYAQVKEGTFSIDFADWFRTKDINLDHFKIFDEDILEVENYE